MIGHVHTEPPVCATRQPTNHEATRLDYGPATPGAGPSFRRVRVDAEESADAHR